MTLANSYLITTKNLESFFNAVLSAQAPERFTQKFLENLEFKSTNDRLFIRLLKDLKFLDDSGVPTQKYYDFLDQTQSKRILAEAIEEAYSDLFSVKKDAYNLSAEEVKNKLKTLTQGQKSDKVLKWMANTFDALCDYADWSKTKKEKSKKQEEIIPQQEIKKELIPNIKMPSLNYNIQIHLPETRDVAVYDAIFKSLKEHLLR